MENLTFENTFNELTIQFPNAMNALFVWFNDYRVRPESNGLFQNNFKWDLIPFEIQAGIILYFLNSHALIDKSVVGAFKNINHFKIFLVDRFRFLEILLEPNPANPW